MVVYTTGDRIFITSACNVGIGTIPAVPFDVPSITSLTVPSGTSAQRVSAPGMFRYNTDLGNYEVNVIGFWAPFTITPTLDGVSSNVLRNLNDAVTVSGTSLAPAAEWRFIGASKRLYFPKSVTYLNDSNVLLVRPDVFPVSDAPYQIQCRQFGKVAYYSGLTAGSNPYFITAGGLVATIAASNLTFTGLNPAAVITAADDGNIGNIIISSGSLPPGLIGTVSSSNYIITGTPIEVTNETTYPFALTVVDQGGNALTQAFSIKLLPPVSRRWPPASLIGMPDGATNPASVTLSGQAYGNGTYVAQASSLYGGLAHPVRAPFDYDTTTWGGGAWADLGNYNGTTGAYTGASSTTASGTAHAGEWIQLQLPSAILLKEIILREPEHRNATSYVFVGSNDGVTWTLIVSRTAAAATTSTSSLAVYSTTIPVSVSETYRYIRLVIKSINPANKWGFCTVWEIEFYGLGG